MFKLGSYMIELMTKSKKRKNHKRFTIRSSLLIWLLIIVVVGIGMIIWNQHQYVMKSDSNNISYREALSGRVSRLDIREWGVSLSFKDADKVKYEVAQTRGNHLELYARGVLLPANDCSRLGATFNRSKSKNQDYHNTHLGNYYYYFSSSPSYCHPNQPDNPRTASIKKTLASNGFGPGDYTITVL